MHCVGKRVNFVLNRIDLRTYMSNNAKICLEINVGMIKKHTAAIFKILILNYFPGVHSPKFS